MLHCATLFSAWLTICAVGAAEKIPEYLPVGFIEGLENPSSDLEPSDITPDNNVWGNIYPEDSSDIQYYDKAQNSFSQNENNESGKDPGSFSNGDSQLQDISSKSQNPDCQQGASPLFSNAISAKAYPVMSAFHRYDVVFYKPIVNTICQNMLKRIMPDLSTMPHQLPKLYNNEALTLEQEFNPELDSLRHRFRQLCSGFPGNPPFVDRPGKLEKLHPAIRGRQIVASLQKYRRERLPTFILAPRSVETFAQYRPWILRYMVRFLPRVVRREKLLNQVLQEIKEVVFGEKEKNPLKPRESTFVLHLPSVLGHLQKILPSIFHDRARREDMLNVLKRVLKKIDRDSSTSKDTPPPETQTTKPPKSETDHSSDLDINEWFEFADKSNPDIFKEIENLFANSAEHPKVPSSSDNSNQSPSSPSPGNQMVSETNDSPIGSERGDSETKGSDGITNSVSPGSETSQDNSANSETSDPYTGDSSTANGPLVGSDPVKNPISSSVTTNEALPDSQISTGGSDNEPDNSNTANSPPTGTDHASSPTENGEAPNSNNQVIHTPPSTPNNENHSPDISELSPDNAGSPSTPEFNYEVTPAPPARLLTRDEIIAYIRTYYPNIFEDNNLFNAIVVQAEGRMTTADAIPVPLDEEDDDITTTAAPITISKPTPVTSIIHKVPRRFLTREEIIEYIKDKFPDIYNNESLLEVAIKHLYGKITTPEVEAPNNEPTTSKGAENDEVISENGEVIIHNGGDVQITTPQRSPKIHEIPRRFLTREEIIEYIKDKFPDIYNNEPLLQVAIKHLYGKISTPEVVTSATRDGEVYPTPINEPTTLKPAENPESLFDNSDDVTTTTAPITISKPTPVTSIIHMVPRRFLTREEIIEYIKDKFPDIYNNEPLLEVTVERLYGTLTTPEVETTPTRDEPTTPKRGENYEEIYDNRGDVQIITPKHFAEIRFVPETTTIDPLHDTGFLNFVKTNYPNIVGDENFSGRLIQIYKNLNVDKTTSTTTQADFSDIYIDNKPVNVKNQEPVDPVTFTIPNTPVNVVPEKPIQSQENNNEQANALTSESIPELNINTEANSMDELHGKGFLDFVKAHYPDLVGNKEFLNNLFLDYKRLNQDRPTASIVFSDPDIHYRPDFEVPHEPVAQGTTIPLPDPEGKEPDFINLQPNPKYPFEPVVGISKPWKPILPEFPIKPIYGILPATSKLPPPILFDKIVFPGFNLTRVSQPSESEGENIPESPQEELFKYIKDKYPHISDDMELLEHLLDQLKAELNTTTAESRKRDTGRAMPAAYYTLIELYGKLYTRQQNGAVLTENEVKTMKTIEEKLASDKKFVQTYRPQFENVRLAIQNHLMADPVLYKIYQAIFVLRPAGHIPISISSHTTHTSGFYPGGRFIPGKWHYGMAAYPQAVFSHRTKQYQSYNSLYGQGKDPRANTVITQHQVRQGGDAGMKFKFPVTHRPRIIYGADEIKDKLSHIRPPISIYDGKTINRLIHNGQFEPMKYSPEINPEYRPPVYYS